MYLGKVPSICRPRVLAGQHASSCRRRGARRRRLAHRRPVESVTWASADPVCWERMAWHDMIWHMGMALGAPKRDWCCTDSERAAATYQRPSSVRIFSYYVCTVHAGIWTLRAMLLT